MSEPGLTTQSELDALPDGSKLLGPDGTVWHHSHSQWWRNDVDLFDHESQQVAALGPLVLIWSPDA